MSRTVTIEPGLYDAKTLGKILGITDRMVRMKMVAGVIPSKKLGNSLVSQINKPLTVKLMNK